MIIALLAHSLRIVLSFGVLASCYGILNLIFWPADLLLARHSGNFEKVYNLSVLAV